MFKFKKGNISETKSSPNYSTKSYFSNIASAKWFDRSYDKFSKEAYINNVIAHRCISMIARSASNINFTLRENGNRIYEHSLLKLIARPNPTQSKSLFLESLFSHKIISGNAFIQGVFPKIKGNGKPSELYLLKPDCVSVVKNGSPIPLAYKYKVNNDEKVYYVNPINGKSEILHIKNFHPTNDTYGLSAIEPASYSIDQHNEASKWNQAMLQNGARPSGALIVKGDSNGSGNLTDEQFERLKTQLNDEFSGSINASKPLLLEGGLDWKEMSMSHHDMDFLNTKNTSAREIALAFGVPSQLLGIPGDNTYSNMAEARLFLWEQTILPMLDNLMDELNSWLTPMFSENLKIFYDKDSISALSIKNDAMWTRVSNASFLTEIEKKELLGIG